MYYVCVYDHRVALTKSSNQAAGPGSPYMTNVWLVEKSNHM